MKIIACIKRVPATDAQAKIDASASSLDTSSFQYMTSFYDEIAVEEAVKTKESHGGEVTILTLGPAEASLQQQAHGIGVEHEALRQDREVISRARLLVKRSSTPAQPTQRR